MSAVFLPTDEPWRGSARVAQPCQWSRIGAANRGTDRRNGEWGSIGGLLSARPFPFRLSIACSILAVLLLVAPARAEPATPIASTRAAGACPSIPSSRLLIQSNSALGAAKAGLAVVNPAAR